jgi:hypothetical protein
MSYEIDATSAEPRPDLATIEAKIVSLADAHLTSGRPYLLSKLGNDLGEDLRWLKVLTGKTLGQFIHDHMSPQYLIVLTGQHNNVQAIVPGQGGVARYREAGQTVVLEPDKLKSDGLRYHYRFWAAFSVPTEGGRRFLNLQDFTFQDLPEAPSGDYVEVEEEYIAEINIKDRDELIKKNILRWLAHKGFSAEQFVARRERSTYETRERSILDAIIDTLDRRQLANTNMSLDVVADLMRRRI